MLSKEKKKQTIKGAYGNYKNDNRNKQYSKKV